MKLLLLESINPIVFQLVPQDWEIIELSSLAQFPYSDWNTIDIICIRSKTKLTKDVLSKFSNLKVIGCFCIGTDQVDLEYADKLGITVFNSPYANSRSVAEIVIAQIINLSRQVINKNILMSKGIWSKSCQNCYQILGKTLGIIGYGHVGSQVGILAENIGMKVVYYDIIDKMPHLSNKKCETLQNLLQKSDYVTLHVPSTCQTNNMITSKELSLMKRGSYLINYSRGNVINYDDLIDFIENKHLAGVCLDVFDSEPESSYCEWYHKLQEYIQNYNVILTPHIGGSTIEAQENVAKDVTKKIVEAIKNDFC